MATLPFTSLEEMAAWQLTLLASCVGNASVENVTGSTPPTVGETAAVVHRLKGTKVVKRHVGLTAHQKTAAKPKVAHVKATTAAKTKTKHAATARVKATKAAHPSRTVHRAKTTLKATAGELGLEVGTITAYTPPTASTAGKATVQLQGSASRLVANVPITQGVPTDLVVLGAQCMVALLDPNNLSDALIVGVYNAAPARLWQGEGVSVAVAAAQVTQHVTFPTPFPATLHSVQVSSQDPAWVAIARNLTTTGFDIVLTTVGANPGVVGTPRYVQGEGAVVAVLASASTGTLAVVFPTSYATVHSCVATSQDPAWHAVVTSLTASGFTIAVQNVLARLVSDATYNTPSPNNASTPVVKTAAAVIGQTLSGGGGVNVTVDWMATGEVAYSATVVVDWTACGV